MKQGLRATGLVLWFVLAVPPRAYANNPPAADGVLSLILIFPVVILGVRLGRAKLGAGSRSRRPLLGVGLILLVLATMSSPDIGLFAMLGVVAYGITRGIQVMLRGQGTRRFVVGIAIIVFALCAGGNYTLAMSGWNYANQHWVARWLIGDIVDSELTFRSDKNGTGRFGTLDELRNPRLRLPLPGRFDNLYLGFLPRGYRFVVVLTGDPARDEKEFFVYATPVRYRKNWLDRFPVFFSSSLSFLLRQPPAARFTYAADETGAIRRADLGGSRPVTRGETSTWELVRLGSR